MKPRQPTDLRLNCRARQLTPRAGKQSSWRWGLAGAVVFHVLVAMTLGKLAWSGPARQSPVTPIYYPLAVEILTEPMAPTATVAGNDGGADFAPPQLPAPPRLEWRTPELPSLPTAPSLPDVIAVVAANPMPHSSVWLRPAGDPEGEVSSEPGTTSEAASSTPGGTGIGENTGGGGPSVAGYLRNPPPPYPAEAKARGWEGTTVLRVCVAPTGIPRELLVAQSSGYPVLDEAAVRAVKRWRFLPARAAGTAVTAWVEVPVVFTLAKEATASSGFSSGGKHGAMAAVTRP